MLEQLTQWVARIASAVNAMAQADAKRDDLIADLRARVEVLENRMAEGDDAGGG